MTFIKSYPAECPPSGKYLACFGRDKPYYTLFDTEFRFLYKHFLISCCIGLILFLILFYLKKKNYVKLSLYTIIILSIILILCLFLIFAYFFPVETPLVFY